MLDRRHFMGGLGVTSLALPSWSGTAQASRRRSDGLVKELADIEHRVGGRLGVTALDTDAITLVAYRGAERLPMCSTFKLMAAAAVLRRVDHGQEKLTRRIRFDANIVVENSPVTRGRTGGDGMSLAELCEAAITRSDNTAGNLLLETIGGTQGLTAFARSLGDGMTRLDRTEPSLNEAMPGDPRDTTTPSAMARNIRRLAFSNILSKPARAQLVSWLAANKTGDTRLRARLPAGLRVADKTGSGERGTTNDVGILWPPGASPLIVAVYLTQAFPDPAVRDRAIADVGAAVAIGIGSRV